MSTNSMKKLGLLTLELALVVATLAGVCVALSHPACAEKMLGAALDGVAAGVYVGCVKAMDRISRTKLACQPFVCWWCFTRAVLIVELRAGFLGGWMLGVTLAALHYFRHN
jgi:hypothetical protein